MAELSTIRRVIDRVARPFSPAAPIAADAPYELTPGEDREQNVQILYAAPTDTYIDVFWKDFNGVLDAHPRMQAAVGPILSLVVRGYEVLRFDCLGPGGHFHVALVRPEPTPEIRLWFHEPTALEQTERAIFELSTNLDYYLCRNPVAAVRQARIDPAHHQQNCREARTAAFALWERNFPGFAGRD